MRKVVEQWQPWCQVWDQGHLHLHLHLLLPKASVLRKWQAFRLYSVLLLPLQVSLVVCPPHKTHTGRTWKLIFNVWMQAAVRAWGWHCMNIPVGPQWWWWWGSSHAPSLLHWRLSCWLACRHLQLPLRSPPLYGREFLELVSYKRIPVPSLLPRALLWVSPQGCLAILLMEAKKLFLVGNAVWLFPEYLISNLYWYPCIHCIFNAVKF